MGHAINIESLSLTCLINSAKLSFNMHSFLPFVLHPLQPVQCNIGFNALSLI